jgi:predicted amidophosphoribosyltransferase
MKCGLLLGKQCPVCTHINPPGTDHCENCAEPLDTVTSIATRLYERTDEAALVRSERLVASKQSDLIYMHEQRERLQAEEQERLARLAAMRIEAQKQQRKLLIVVGVMLAVLGIGGIVLALLLASAPAP